MPNRLREIRQQKGLSIPDLAKAAGVSCGHISDIERGKHDVTLRTAVRLARALEVPAEVLFPVLASEIPASGSSS